MKKKDAFSAEKPPFRPAATIWAVLEHFYSEMAAEPPFFIQVHCTQCTLAQAQNSLDSTAHEQLFSPG
jgi:hypothetical protein